MSISEQLIIKCYTNNIKIDHKTTTTILLGCFAVLRLTFDVVYMHTTLDDSRFSRSRDTIGPPKF